MIAPSRDSIILAIMKGHKMAQTQTIGRHATKVKTENGWTFVTYHATTVIRFNYEHIILDSGGWQTLTTKNRMNQASNQFGLGIYVYQKDFNWFVHIETTGERLPFKDGMTIKRDFE